MIFGEGFLCLFEKHAQSIGQTAVGGESREIQNVRIQGEANGVHGVNVPSGEDSYSRVNNIKSQYPRSSHLGSTRPPELTAARSAASHAASGSFTTTLRPLLNVDRLSRLLAPGGSVIATLLWGLKGRRRSVTFCDSTQSAGCDLTHDRHSLDSWEAVPGNRPVAGIPVGGNRPAGYILRNSVHPSDLDLAVARIAAAFEAGHPGEVLRSTGLLPCLVEM